MENIDEINAQIDEAFEELETIGLGTLIVRTMKDTLDTVIDNTMAQFGPMLNETQVVDPDRMPGDSCNNPTCPCTQKEG